MPGLAQTRAQLVAAQAEIAALRANTGSAGELDDLRRALTAANQRAEAAEKRAESLAERLTDAEGRLADAEEKLSAERVSGRPATAGVKRTAVTKATPKASTGVSKPQNGSV